MCHNKSVEERVAIGQKGRYKCQGCCVSLRACMSSLLYEKGQREGEREGKRDESLLEKKNDIHFNKPHGSLSLE